MSHKCGHLWNRYINCVESAVVVLLNDHFLQYGPDDSGIFKTLRIQSQHKDQIAFEIDLSLLERALKSCEPAEMASLKLSKKASSAFLCFEIIIQVFHFAQTICALFSFELHPLLVKPECSNDDGDSRCSCQCAHRRWGKCDCILQALYCLMGVFCDFRLRHSMSQLLQLRRSSWARRHSSPSPLSWRD